jgi:DNA-binding NarL/FixJ family response regulator
MSAVAPRERDNLFTTGSVASARPKRRTAADILAVDSRPLVRSGLARLARCAFDTPASGVADLAQAAAVLRLVDTPPRALLLGIRAGDDPSALVNDARRLGVPVVLVLDCEDAELFHAALSAHADGYLVLDLADADSIRETVEAVEAGEQSVPPELRGSCGHPRQSDPMVTVRCLEVLRSLAEGLHDDEIAARLGISTSSVRKHICGAQGRLRARTRIQAVAMIAKRGLL